MKIRSEFPRRAVISMMLGAGALALNPSLALGADLSAEAFRELVIAVGARYYPALPMQPAGPLQVLWGSHHLYLYNAYAGIRALPPEYREAAIHDFIARFSPEADAKAASLVAAAETWDKARSLLRPRMLPTQTVTSAPRVMHQPFFAGVVIGYAIDLGDKDLYVDRRRFTQWGVSMEQLHATALDNLEAMSSTLPTAKHLAKDNGGFVALATNDGYDAARILLPGLRARLLAALGPTVFAAIPGRDLLVVWPEHFDRRDGIEGFVRECAQQMPHRLTEAIFAVDKDGVRPA